MATAVKQLSNETLDEAIAELLTRCVTEADRYEAFAEMFRRSFVVPARACVAGSPVDIRRFQFDGNLRRGLTATCVSILNGRQYSVSAADIELHPGSPLEPMIAGYRRWMGLQPYLTKAAPPKRPRVKSTPPVSGGQFAVLSIDGSQAQCRQLETKELQTIAVAPSKRVCPGEILTLDTLGRIRARHIEAKALDLIPLALHERGLWDPKELAWKDDWTRPIVAWGPRTIYEMQQIIPGDDPYSLDDPIIKALDVPRRSESRAALLRITGEDLRCLDAYANLGFLAFNSGGLKEALRCFELGVAIGNLSLGDNFDGTLLWGLIANRPYLRCLHGYALSLWRLERFEEAGSALRRLLWLNPGDNQGAHTLLPHVDARIAWNDSPF